MASVNDEYKKCSKCELFKPLLDFYKRSDKKHLYQSHCILCVRSNNITSSKKHFERLSSQQKGYNKINREKRILYSKLYNQKNREKRREKDKERYRIDIEFRLTQNLRTRIRLALKRNSKSHSTNTLLGCDIPFLKDYLKSLFTLGMSWDNYGEWQVDHIKPCAKFDLIKEENQLKCFNYKNLQPLWALDNLIKKDKYINEKEVCHR